MWCKLYFQILLHLELAIWTKNAKTKKTEIQNKIKSTNDLITSYCHKQPCTALRMK